MRKEEVASLFVYLVMIAFAIILGLTVLRDAMPNLRPEHLNVYAFVIIVIIVGLLFNIVMLEVLHALGGKLGGYKVVSINILGFCFEKREGKTHFKFKDFDGLTGETKLAPSKDKLSLKPYIWLPLFAYAVELAGGIVLFSSMNKGNADKSIRWLGAAAILFVIISSMIALYNLMPFKLDSMTDGYKLMLISKKENVDAMNELLRVENLQREGKEVGELKVFTNITEFTANINLISVYNHLKEHNYEEAEKIIEINLADQKKVEPSTWNRMIAQKLYIDILTKDVEEVKKIYNEVADDNIRRFIANDNEMESIRAYILIAGILEGSAGEVKYAANKKNKGLKRALASRAKIEEQLFEEALEKVYSIHPEWKQQENAAN